MTVKIEKKIVSYQVKDATETALPVATAESEQIQLAADSLIPEGGATIVQMHEKVLRPEM